MTPAIDEPTAARILGLAHAPHSSRSRALTSFALILALAAHAAIGGGFPDPAQSAAMSPAGASPPARESAHMKRLMAIGAVAAAVAASGAIAQNAVQWRVEDGGNGHWYRIVLFDASLNWQSANSISEYLGGHLATLGSIPEHAFILPILNAATHPDGGGGVWLGGFQVSGDPEPAGFRWVTGEPFGFAGMPWSIGNPSNSPHACNGDRLGESFISITTPIDCSTYGDSTCVPGSLNDRASCPADTRALLLEFSADCNSDGIVDYGQIRTGELADANTNNIPDCCENATPCGCAGDTNLDASVDGIDLATVLTRWAQPAAKFPEADCNRDGVIDGADLAIVLGSWGACP